MSDKPSLLEIAQALGMNRYDVAKLAREGLVVEGDLSNPLGVVAVSCLVGNEGKVETREFRRPEVALTEEGAYTVFLRL